MIELKSIYFIVNANSKIGAGHLKRCISIANKLVNHDEITKIIFTGWITDRILIKGLHFPYLKLRKSEINEFDNKENFDKSKPVTQWERQNTLDC